MRSKQQNNDWIDRITWNYDHMDSPEELRPKVPWELAQCIWSSENADIETYRDRLLGYIKDEESLRQYLDFEAMDASLWSTFSVLIYWFIERDDITEMEAIIKQITTFVQMCSHFYKLRFAKLMEAGSEKNNEIVQTTGKDAS